MATPMTKQEFDALRKLANKAKKHVNEIGKCNDFMLTVERIELQELRETATMLLNCADKIYHQHA